MAHHLSAIIRHLHWLSVKPIQTCHTDP